MYNIYMIGTTSGLCTYTLVNIMCAHSFIIPTFYDSAVL